MVDGARLMPEEAGVSYRCVLGAAAMTMAAVQFNGIAFSALSHVRLIDSRK
jgi:hypothetical protein